MSTFLDGPAEGQSMILRRAPHFLRVTQRGAKFDALDRLEDKPFPEETVTAYELADAPIRGMIDGKNYRGPFTAGCYRVVKAQPPETVLRDAEAWRAWCMSRDAERKGVAP